MLVVLIPLLTSELQRGETALSLACISGSASSVSYLIHAGASLNIVFQYYYKNTLLSQTEFYLSYSHCINVFSRWRATYFDWCGGGYSRICTWLFFFEPLTWYFVAIKGTSEFSLSLPELQRRYCSYDDICRSRCQLQESGALWYFYYYLLPSHHTIVWGGCIVRSAPKEKRRNGCESFAR